MTELQDEHAKILTGISWASAIFLGLCVASFIASRTVSDGFAPIGGICFFIAFVLFAIRHAIGDDY
jgi:hypothetical protein